MATTIVQPPGVYYSPDGKKTFIPLENNPAVFSELAHKLGLSSEVDFYDVFSVTEPDLTAMVPRPVLALILLVPAKVYYRVRGVEGGVRAQRSGHWWYEAAGSEPVMWFRQTIGHACGLMSLLHALANVSARPFVQQDSVLDRLFQQATPLHPHDRAELLYNSTELEQAHMSVAVKGDTTAPDPRQYPGYHFITFCKGTDGHLYELEGSKDAGGPIDLGHIIAESQDIMSEEAMSAGVRRYVNAAEGSTDLSIVALSHRMVGE